MVPTLAADGWDLSYLSRLARSLSSVQLPAVVRWIATDAAVGALLEEIDESAERIDQTVQAVRSYSYLDRGLIQEVDVREGLESTLVILRHKLTGGIKVVRSYEPDLPRIVAYGAELNQAWTNLIDNAVDAMSGRGVLTLRTWRDGDHVVVEVGDDGPGIPAEVQSRIFEPFFTTKPQGMGAGLGLHVTHNTVVHKHRGQIGVTSKPGATRFEVRLPIQLQRGESPSPLR